MKIACDNYSLEVGFPQSQRAACFVELDVVAFQGPIFRSGLFIARVGLTVTFQQRWLPGVMPRPLGSCPLSCMEILLTMERY
ncbi:hypothetical protein BK654_29260 [Pseudomonas brassicacearum]|nr:hypothetical protein BK654_29260 [Pseudomonas brassicacearum]